MSHRSKVFYDLTSERAQYSDSYIHTQTHMKSSSQIHFLSLIFPQHEILLQLVTGTWPCLAYQVCVTSCSQSRNKFFLLPDLRIKDWKGSGTKQSNKMDECVFQMWGKKEAGVIYMWFMHSLMSHSCSDTAADQTGRLITSWTTLHLGVIYRQVHVIAVRSQTHECSELTDYKRKTKTGRVLCRIIKKK